MGRPDRRVDPRSGAPVVITGTRQDRPNLPAGACPFCPGGLEAPALYTVRSFVNRWPPLPDGRAEILLYSPRHDASLWSLGVDGARAVVDLWADRTAALGTRDDVAYVLVFENRGAEVGATIPHPHGQLYAFDAVPPVAARELAAGTCPVCAEDTRDRLVARAGDWWAAVPGAARYPYELLVAPSTHLPDLPGLHDFAGAVFHSSIRCCAMHCCGGGCWRCPERRCAPLSARARGWTHPTSCSAGFRC